MPVVSVFPDSDQFYEVLGYRPDIARAWKRLDSAMHAPSSTLPWKLKENVRRLMSQHVGCEFCASFGEPELDALTPREEIAVEFTERLIKDYRSIDEVLIEAMRQQYTDEQLIELIAWTCFKLGANMFGALTRLEPASEAVRVAAAETHRALLNEDEKRRLRSAEPAGGDGR